MKKWLPGTIFITVMLLLLGVMVSKVLWDAGVIGSYHADIKQRVMLDSMLSNTYYVTTSIAVYKGGDWIDWYDSKHDRSDCDGVPALKKTGMEWAIKKKAEAEEALKNFKMCKYAD